MPPDMLGPWANFGLAGLVICALFLTLWKGFGTVVMKILDLHQTERQEWRQSFERVSGQADARQAESNELLRDLTTAISDIKRTP
jgi:hypothetical protein